MNNLKYSAEDLDPKEDTEQFSSCESEQTKVTCKPQSLLLSSKPFRVLKIFDMLSDNVYAVYSWAFF